MRELSDLLSSGFIRYFAFLSRRVHDLMSNLSEEEIWRNPYGYGNSFGHLMLHVTGNLNYYIGANISGTGYVRNRNLEFSTEKRPSAEELLQSFDEAVAMVKDTARNLDETGWAEGSIDSSLDDNDLNHFETLMTCAGHLYHHIGQMIYINKEHLKGGNK